MDGQQILAAVQQFIDENDRQKHEYMREVLELRSKVEYLERDLELLRHMNLQLQTVPKTAASNAQTQTANDDKLQVYRTKYYKYKMMYLGQPAVCSACNTRIPLNARQRVTQDGERAAAPAGPPQPPLLSPAELASRSPPASISPGEAPALGGTPDSQHHDSPKQCRPTVHIHQPGAQGQQPALAGGPAQVEAPAHHNMEYQDGGVLQPGDHRFGVVAYHQERQQTTGPYQQPHGAVDDARGCRNQNLTPPHAYPNETQGVLASPQAGANQMCYVPETYLPDYHPAYGYPDSRLHPQLQHLPPQEGEHPHPPPQPQAYPSQQPWQDIGAPGPHEFQHHSHTYYHQGALVAERHNGQMAAAPAQPQDPYLSHHAPLPHAAPPMQYGAEMPLHGGAQYSVQDPGHGHGMQGPPQQAAPPMGYVGAQDPGHSYGLQGPPQQAAPPMGYVGPAHQHTSAVNHQIRQHGWPGSARSDPGHAMRANVTPPAGPGNVRRMSSPGHVPSDFSPAWRGQADCPSPRPAVRHTPSDVKRRSRQVWLAIQQASNQDAQPGQDAPSTEQANVNQQAGGGQHTAPPSVSAEGPLQGVYALGYTCLANGPSPAAHTKRPRMAEADTHRPIAAALALVTCPPSPPDHIGGPASLGKPDGAHPQGCNELHANGKGSGMHWSDVMAHIQASMGPAPAGAQHDTTAAAGPVHPDPSGSTDLCPVREPVVEHVQGVYVEQPIAAPQHDMQVTAPGAGQQQRLDGPSVTAMARDAPAHAVIKPEPGDCQHRPGPHPQQHEPLQPSHGYTQQHRPLQELQPSNQQHQQPSHGQKQVKPGQTLQHRQTADAAANGCKADPRTDTSDKWKTSQRRTSHPPATKGVGMEVLNNRVQTSITRYRAQPRQQSDSGSGSADEGLKPDATGTGTAGQHASKRARLHAWQVGGTRASQGTPQAGGEGAAAEAGVALVGQGNCMGATHRGAGDTAPSICVMDGDLDAVQAPRVSKSCGPGRGSAVLAAHRATGSTQQASPRPIAPRQRTHASPVAATGRKGAAVPLPLAQHQQPSESSGNIPPPGFQRRRRTESVADDLAAVPRPSSKQNYTTCSVQPVHAAQMPMSSRAGAGMAAADVSHTGQFVAPVTIQCVVDRPPGSAAARRVNPPSDGAGGQPATSANHTAAADMAGNVKYQEVVRGKAARDALQGYACQQCQDFYEAMASWKQRPGLGEDQHHMRPHCGHAPPTGAGVAGVSGSTLASDGATGHIQAQMVQDNSRHRVRYVPPSSTPDGFWSLTFPEAPRNSPSW